MIYEKYCRNTKIISVLQNSINKISLDRKTFDEKNFPKLISRNNEIRNCIQKSKNKFYATMQSVMKSNSLQQRKIKEWTL